MKSIKNTILLLLLLSGYSARSQWSSVDLPTARTRMAGIYADGKAFFAGGFSQIQPAYVVSAAVDIYNLSSGQWTTKQLSEARADVAAAIAGNKILFAGGHKILANGATQYFNTVDVYDRNTGVWSTGTLPAARTGMKAVTVGSKAFFIGGRDNSAHNDVYVYDGSNGNWSTLAIPSGARTYVAAAAVGTKVICAGGNDAGSSSANVDIYNTAAGSWSSALLYLPRENISAITVGNKCFFVGGAFNTYESILIDIFDNSNNTWGGTTTIFGRQDATLTELGGKMYIAGGSPVSGASPFIEVYDAVAGDWDDPAFINFPNFASHCQQTGLSTPYGILLAGGQTNVAGIVEKTVYILGATTATQAPKKPEALKIFPSPAADAVFISTGETTGNPGDVKFAELVGMDGSSRQVQFTPASDGTLRLDIDQMPAGTYSVRMTDGDKIWAGRFVKL